MAGYEAEARIVGKFDATEIRAEIAALTADLQKIATAPRGKGFDVAGARSAATNVAASASASMEAAILRGAGVEAKKFEAVIRTAEDVFLSLAKSGSDSDEVLKRFRSKYNTAANGLLEAFHSAERALREQERATQAAAAAELKEAEAAERAAALKAKGVTVKTAAAPPPLFAPPRPSSGGSGSGGGGGGAAGGAAAVPPIPGARTVSSGSIEGRGILSLKDEIEANARRLALSKAILANETLNVQNSKGVNVATGALLDLSVKRLVTERQAETYSLLVQKAILERAGIDGLINRAKARELYNAEVTASNTKFLKAAAADDQLIALKAEQVNLTRGQREAQARLNALVEERAASDRGITAEVKAQEAEKTEQLALERTTTKVLQAQLQDRAGFLGTSAAVLNQQNTNAGLSSRVRAAIIDRSSPVAAAQVDRGTLIEQGALERQRLKVAQLILNNDLGILALKSDAVARGRLLQAREIEISNAAQQRAGNFGLYTLERAQLNQQAVIEGQRISVLQATLRDEKGILTQRTANLVLSRERTALEDLASATTIRGAGRSGITRGSAAAIDKQNALEEQRITELEGTLVNENALKSVKVEQLVLARRAAELQARVNADVLRSAGTDELIAARAAQRREALTIGEDELEVLHATLANEKNLLVIAAAESSVAAESEAARIEIAAQKEARKGITTRLREQLDIIDASIVAAQEDLVLARASLADRATVVASGVKLNLDRLNNAFDRDRQTAARASAPTGGLVAEAGSTERDITQTEKERLTVLRATLRDEQGLLSERVAQARLTVINRQLAAQADLQVLQRVGITGELAAQKKELETEAEREAQRIAILEGTLANDRGILEAKGEQLARQRVIAGLEASAAAAVGAQAGASGLSTAAAGTLKQQIQVQQERLLVAEATLRNDENLLGLKAREYALQRQLNSAEQAAAVAAREKAVADGQVAAATRTQRLLARLTPARGGVPADPLDKQTIGQLFGAAGVTTARFAASGLLLYGAISGVGKIVSEAQDLEKTLNQIKRQFDSLGQSSNFSQFRDSILQIARDTGSAATDVARVGFQLQGAFGGNTSRAIRETATAFEAVKVTGLEIHEVIDAFTAITQSFKDADISIANVTDTALGLQERFGVLAKETVSFAADLAPVASEAGFSAKELEALGAVAQKYSGKSGSSLAEAFGRIFPSLQAKAADFVALFQSVGGADLGGQVAAAFKAGDVEKFFNILLQQYPNLTKSQRDYVIELAGGRREAQALIPILEHSGELLGEFNRQESDAGKTSQYFSDLQQTLNQRLSELGQKFSQLGIQLFNSGVGDFLKDLIGLLTKVVDLMSRFGNVVGSVGGALSGITGITGIGGGGEGGGSGIGLNTVLQGLLTYTLVRGGASLIGGAIGGGGTGLFGRLGAGFTAAGASSGFMGIGGRFASGFGAARDASLLSSASATATYGETFAANAAGVAGGLKSAFAGFNWAAIGTTIGLLVASKISENAAAEARVRAQQVLGSDLAISSPEEEKLNLQGIGVSGADNVRKYAQALSTRNGKPQPVSLKFLREMLDYTGFRKESTGEQLKSTFPGFNLSADDQVKQAQVKALVEKFKGQDLHSPVDALLQNEDLLREFAKDRAIHLFGSLKNAGLDKPETFTKYVEGVRGELNQFGAEIDNESVDVITLMDYLGVLPTAARNVAHATEEAQKKASQQQVQLLDAQEILSKFQSGDIGLAAAKNALQNVIAIKESISKGTPEELAELAKLHKQLDVDLISKSVINEAKAITDLQSQFGAGNNVQNAQLQVQTYLNALKSGKLAPADAKTASDQVIAGLKAMQDARVAATHDTALQAQYLAEGVPVPKEVQTELVFQYLTLWSTEYQDFLFQATGGVEEAGNAIARVAAELHVAEGLSLKNATKKAIALRIADLQQKRDFLFWGAGEADFSAQFAAIDAEIAKLYTQLANDSGIPDITIPDFSTVGKDVQGSQDKANAAAQKAIAVRKAQLDVQRAIIQGDPVAEADLAIAAADLDRQAAELQQDPQDRQQALLEAQAALINAQKQRAQAVIDQAAALRDLDAARSGDDPIKLAEAALANARDAEAAAVGVTAKANAEAARIRAERALNDAIADVGNSRLELLEAMANAAGDTVEAARVALDLARRKLTLLIQGGADETQINRAKAEVLAAERAANDAVLKQKEDDIAFDLEMKKITKAQAIALLQQLLTIPTNTLEEIRDIQRKIQQLKGELGQDFRFNLPSILGLPTQYSVRRDVQGGYGGAQDNRQINVEVIVTTNADPRTIAETVAKVVGAPSQMSFANRRY